MSRALDSRFRLIVEMMNDAGSNIERAAARESAEDVARACGFTFLEAMAELRKPAGMLEPAELPPSPPPAVEPPHVSHLSTVRGRTIVEALAADPNRSDRDIAREAGCSPTTVGRARAAAGLAGRVRTVRRGSQAFEMALSRRADARPFD